MGWACLQGTVVSLISNFFSLCDFDEKGPVTSLGSIGAAYIMYHLCCSTEVWPKNMSHSWGPRHTACYTPTLVNAERSPNEAPMSDHRPLVLAHLVRLMRLLEHTPLVASLSNMPCETTFCKCLLEVFFFNRLIPHCHLLQVIWQF